MNPFGEVARFMRAALVDPVPRDHQDTPTQRTRRRIVVGITMLAGAVALGAALAIRPGDTWFYPATMGVGVVWMIGALLSGKLHLGQAWTRTGQHSRAVVQGLILGGLLLAIFLAGALVVDRIPALRGPVSGLLDHARYGSLPIVAIITAFNGVAEELFFRGAVYASFPRRINAIATTVLYALSTVLSGVPLLTFAAVCLGLLTAAQRRVTGGVVGPIVSHLTWSLGMLFLLPLLIR